MDLRCKPPCNAEIEGLLRAVGWWRTVTASGRWPGSDIAPVVGLLEGGFLRDCVIWANDVA